MVRTLIVGTRGSALALAQTQIVIKMIRKENKEQVGFNVKPIRTQGDVPKNQKLTGKESFTGTIDEALEKGEIDFAVHSLKDVPLEDSRRKIELASFPERGSPLDALVTIRKGLKIENLPLGSRVGTSSARRALQLKSYREDLKIVEVHGNVNTRIKKLRSGSDGLDAIVLATAGIERLGMSRLVNEEVLPPEIMLPAPGQGCLVISTRKGDSDTKKIVRMIDDERTRLNVTAERSFSREFGGGCNLPVAALAESDGKNIKIEGLVAKDENFIIRDSIVGRAKDADSIGRKLAQKLIQLGR